MEEKKHPVEEVSFAVAAALEPFKHLESTDVIAGLNLILVTLLVEMDMPEEKATYSFRKSFGQAERRHKALMKTKKAIQNAH